MALERARSVLTAVARVLLVLAGLTAISLGLYLAWGQSNAVLFAAVGVLLLLLGAMGADWREVIAKFGDKEFTVRRRELAQDASELGALAEQVKELAARKADASDVDDAVRREVLRRAAEIGDSARAIAGGLTLTGTATGRSYSTGAIGAGVVADTFVAIAKVERDAVELVLTGPRLSTVGLTTSGYSGFVCTVVAPDGSTWTTQKRSETAFLITAAQEPLCKATYPADFAGAPLVEGVYRVDWSRSVTQTWHVSSAPPFLAHTSFTITKTSA